MSINKKYVMAGVLATALVAPLTQTLMQMIQEQ